LLLTLLLLTLLLLTLLLLTLLLLTFLLLTLLSNSLLNFQVLALQLCYERLKSLRSCMGLGLNFDLRVVKMKIFDCLPLTSISLGTGKVHTQPFIRRFDIESASIVAKLKSLVCLIFKLLLALLFFLERLISLQYLLELGFSFVFLSKISVRM
jgi:hypothetical protein